MTSYCHLLKSKIHRAVVTEANLNYFGSISIDETLMRAASLRQFEKVLITNMRNGERLETYVIKGQAGSGEICMNGPSAHLISAGDEILIMAFTMVEEEKAALIKPIVIFPNDNNKSFDSIKYDADSFISH